MDDIGRYRIIGELGSGGMGIVLRAYDPVLGREVAIKTLKLTELSDPAEREGLRDRLGREARAAAALSHPGIVAIYDVLQQGDLVGLVMERIEGQTLAQVLYADAALDIPTVLRIVREAAAALDYAHRKGIVHRDIKPANIMLDENSAVKIADFGIAKITASQTRTQSDKGLIVGTAGYMAPEQLRGAPIEGQADQFSLAVVAYEMLARRRPFMADSLIALTHQVVFEEAPTLSTLRPGLGTGADAVFHKALAKAPADRYPTCSAFASALESQINAGINAPTLALPAIPTPIPALHPSLPVIPPPMTPPTTAPTKIIPDRSRWRVAMFGLPLLILLAAGVFLRFLPRTPPASQIKPPVAAPVAETPPPAPVTAEPVTQEPQPAPVVDDSPPASAPVKAKAPTSVLKAGTVRINKKDSQKYVWIPPGAFVMGCVSSDEECGSFARPPHQVAITNGFWMAQTDTTVAAYKVFADRDHRDMPKAPKFNPNWTLTDHPMVEVSWEDAVAYCTRAGGRLPAEAEWEYAARGGSAGTVFPWGNDASHDFANFGEGTSSKDERGATGGKDQWINTSPVASFPPNGFHLYDMIGNVSQWCADWFAGSYYSRSPEKDPKGPESGTFRSVRGGSWKSPPRFMRISYRGNRKPQDHGQTTGFRCVVNALP